MLIRFIAAGWAWTWLSIHSIDEYVSTAMSLINTSENAVAIIQSRLPEMEQVFRPVFAHLFNLFA